MIDAYIKIINSDKNIKFIKYIESKGLLVFYDKPLEFESLKRKMNLLIIDDIIVKYDII